MEILETKRGKSGVQSIVVRCGEYTAELTFCENCETDVMIPIKELIMSAYDLRKQRKNRIIGRIAVNFGSGSSPFW